MRWGKAIGEHLINIFQKNYLPYIIKKEKRHAASAWCTLYLLDYCSGCVLFFISYMLYCEMPFLIFCPLEKGFAFFLLICKYSSVVRD